MKAGSTLPSLSLYLRRSPPVPQVSGASIPTPGKGALMRAPPRPVPPRDPTCRARTQGPRPRRPRPRGRGRPRRLRRGRGRGFPAGRVAAPQSRPHRQRPPRAKIKPRGPPAGEPAAAGARLACRVTLGSGASPSARTCGHFPALPASAPGRRKTRMATPPKRSCPSPATGSERTRIKKIAVEGNIGKEPREMFPKRGEPRRRRQPFPASLQLLSEGLLPARPCGCGRGLNSLRSGILLSRPA